MNEVLVVDEPIQIEQELLDKATGEILAAPTLSNQAASVSDYEAPFDPKTGLVPKTFGQLMKLAEIFSKSKMVPAHFQGQPQNCFVALQMAYRMELDPMVALQNIYVVSGKPGLSSQLIISLINRSGKLKSPLKFRVEGKGETLAVTAYGLLQDGDEVSFTVPWSMVKAENWDKNPKYKSMPEVMMRYRAAAFLARFTFPEVIIGMHSVEEIEDVAAAAASKKETTSIVERMKAQV
jgi:hypothetical protein